MQILAPIVHETVWGGKKLTPYSGSDCQKIGHLYSCIDTANLKSSIVWGSFAGKTIHDWFLANRTKYSLDAYNELPVLMALVEAADNLSIQVHPDDEMAAQLERKPFGKNESFFIIEPPESGYLYNGCTASSREEMAKLIEEGRCMDGVGKVATQAGDYVYVTGGTMHAASRGSLSFEIEENCDATYRFYDFDRLDKDGNKRPLQVEQALACLDVSKQSTIRQYVKGEPIVERMYSTEYITEQESFTNEDKSFAIAVLLKGEKIIESSRLLPGAAIVIEPGDQVNFADCEWMLIKVIP